MCEWHYFENLQLSGNIISSTKLTVKSLSLSLSRSLSSLAILFQPVLGGDL